LDAAISDYPPQIADTFAFLLIAEVPPDARSNVSTSRLPRNRGVYLCPAGEQLNYVGLNVRNRAHAYIGSGKRCGSCSQKAQCTSGRYKYLAIHMDETARQRARELVNTPEFAKAQRERKKVEALFAELKNQIGLRRLRLRRLRFVREQFFLAAAAQNLTRLVRFLSQPTIPTVEAAS
jgi:hypothetical protein